MFAQKVLREPLLHFLLLGAVVFGAYDLVASSTSEEPGRIVVTQGQIASTVLGFTRTWQRAPTKEELEGLIGDHVREEVYYREALALRLDKDDVIIRRRLRQKLEFLTDDVAAQSQPTDQDLEAYLKANADRFRTAPRWTFSHVYLNPGKHGEGLARNTTELLVQLNLAGGDTDISNLGDSFLLGPIFDSLPATEVGKLFGESFAAQLSRLEPGRWQGPVHSGYGVHLVFIRERTEGRLPALAEVREAVGREWANSRRLETNEKFYQELLKRYAVIIERPDTGEASKATGTSGK